MTADELMERLVEIDRPETEVVVLLRGDHEIEEPWGDGASFAIVEIRRNAHYRRIEVVVEG